MILGLIGLEQALQNVYAQGLRDEEEIQRQLLHRIKDSAITFRLRGKMTTGKPSCVNTGRMSSIRRNLISLRTEQHAGV